MGTFSLGMNQRLGIAGDPETVILDEPVNGLDPDGILWIRNLMKSLASEGRTVFLSSHLMSEMAQTADPCSSSVGVGSPPTTPSAPAVRSTPISRALTGEWTKLRTLPSTWRRP